MKSVEVYLERKQWTKYMLCVIGALIYSFGMNAFVVPVQLYASGVMGVSQIIETLLVEKAHINLGGFNLTGTIYFLMNLPLFFLAVRQIGKQFLLKTGINVVCVTFFMSVLPVPRIPIMEERLTCAIIGGIICGVGSGIALQAGGSGGGLDILGIYLAKKNKEFSVGRLSLIINGVIYGICILLFDVSVAIYCIIYSTFAAMIVDKVHTQSINVEVMIFTRTDGEAICNIIIQEFNRSATFWKGVGGYTEKDTVIVYSVLSKYEATILRRMVKEKDPHAFIVLQEGCHIAGNFQKHL
ncbi:YitT family protein [Qiania dongpingensis]|uniref:YitT family protein n=1 Tax=Qiania dongpingensis TaxID=2763669 RepID=A0A7G9G5A7_9FIRM|nr:YitT family protein [Qiania dongpingensis]QNM05989.1 YitT family protein [Qiania dongpingensis]